MSIWRNNGIGRNDAIPFYVTRKDGDGMIYAYSVSAWVPIAAIILGGAALVLWCLIALLAALGVLGYGTFLAVSALIGLL